ncbi:hypothetical protein [Latilactobacillus curvatus]|nr:hypothetical protein [Latilactobacillus curvatus]
MADLYIATPTQADYDVLMRLAEAAGYRCYNGEKPTNLHNWDVDRGETVILLDGSRHVLYSDDGAYCESQSATIEKISNLAGIKAIWNVKPEYLDVFSDEKFNTSDIIKDWALNDGVIILLENGSYDLGFEEVYKTLAVEYKPKESEVMSEKVKLPRNVIDVFSPALDSPGYRILGSLTPIRIISDMYNRTLEGMTSDVAAWLNDYDNQWKLIDALRYGYEPEAEPRWGIKAGNCYMNDAYHDSFSNDIDEGFVFYNKSAAESKADKLGFGEAVDFNKEVDGNGE